MQSIPSYPSLNSGMSQIVHRSIGPGTNGDIAVVSDTGQAVMGGYVPASAGYMGPWMWGTGGPVPIGSAGAYGWPGGVPPPVGPQGTAGWVMGLPEQARGTAPATQNPNPVISPIVNYTTGVSGLPAPHSDITTVAAGSYASPSVSFTCRSVRDCGMGYGLARASHGNSTGSRYRDCGIRGGTPATPSHHQSTVNTYRTNTHIRWGGSCPHTGGCLGRN